MTVTAAIDTTAVVNATVKNIETAEIIGSAGVVVDSTAWTGLTAATITGAGVMSVTAAKTTDLTLVNSGANAVTVIGGGLSLNATTQGASITVGGTAVANAYTSATLTNTVGTNLSIQDRSGTSAATGSTLTDVTLKGGATNSVTSNGLTTLTLSGSTGTTTTTITAAAATRALTVNLGANTAETIVDATATTVTVNSTSAHTIAALNFVKATTISVNATANTTVTTIDSEVATALNLDATGGTLTITEADTNADNTIKTVTITGDKLVTLTAVGTGVTSIVASAATGGATVTEVLNVGSTYAGGSGVDTISVPVSHTKAVTTGDGNDVIVIGGAATSTGSVDAGAGTGDVLSLTAALAANNSLGASTTFNGKISGFEILSLSTTAAVTVDMNNLDNLTYVKTVGVANATTISNLDSGGTVEFLAANTDTTTVVVENAALGGNNADVLNLKLGTGTATSGVAVDFLTVVAAGVETINIDSTRTGTIVTADDNTITLTAANLKNLVVTGGVSVNVDTAIAVATLESVDATANTQGIIFSAAAAVQGVSIKGSTAGANTLTGGAGGDSITGGAGIDTIVGGDGNDTITSGNGADVITGGVGNDTIVLTETTAAADDIIFVSAATNGIDQISGFTSTDTFRVAALGQGATAAGGTAVTTAATIRTMADNTSYVITTKGTAADITTGGTATLAVADYTAATLTNLAAYLSEGFQAATAATTEANVFIINDENTDLTYVYSFDNTTAAQTILANELTLVGVINNGGTDLVNANIDYA